MTTKMTDGDFVLALAEVREGKGVRKQRLIEIAVASGACKNKTAADAMKVGDLRDHVIAFLTENTAHLTPALPENAGKHPAPVGVSRSVQNAIIDAEQRAEREERDARAAGYGPALPEPRERRFANHASTQREFRDAQMRRRKRNQRKHKRSRSPWGNGMKPLPTGAELREMTRA